MAIAVPRGATRADADVPLVPCGAWWTPFGPLLRIPPDPHGNRILHVHGIAAATPWSGVRRARGPVVGTMHGTLDWRLRSPITGPRGTWHRRVDLPLLRRLAGIHVTRPSEREALATVGIDPARVTEIPWTLAADPALARSEGVDPYVACVGRLHPIKGLDRLLDAFSVTARAVPKARLKIAGTGASDEEAALRRRAATLGIEARVDFLGLLEREALRRFLADAAVLALASRYENFGMVVLEAAREGCPVVASRETPWAGLEEAGAGRWTDFDAAEETGTALARAFDPAWRRGASVAARRLFEAHAPARVAPRFVAWYESVLRASRDRTAA